MIGWGFVWEALTRLEICSVAQSCHKGQLYWYIPNKFVEYNFLQIRITKLSL